MERDGALRCSLEHIEKCCNYCYTVDVLEPQLLLVEYQSLSLCSSRLLQVCELVKFMIEHCQQILGEDPSSLFGGPPQRPNTEEIGSGTK